MKVFKRSPLDRVSGINQQQIRIVLACFFYQRGHFRDPNVVVFIGVVINRKDTAVHVGRAENDQVHAGRNRVNMIFGKRA